MGQRWWALLKELGRYAWETKRLWMGLLMSFLLLVGMLILFTEGSSFIPYIYALF